MSRQRRRCSYTSLICPKGCIPALPPPPTSSSSIVTETSVYNPRTDEAFSSSRPQVSHYFCMYLLQRWDHEWLAAEMSDYCGNPFKSCSIRRFDIGGDVDVNMMIDARCNRAAPWLHSSHYGSRDLNTITTSYSRPQPANKLFLLLLEAEYTNISLKAEQIWRLSLEMSVFKLRNYRDIVFPASLPRSAARVHADDIYKQQTWPLFFFLQKGKMKILKMSQEAPADWNPSHWRTEIMLSVIIQRLSTMAPLHEGNPNVIAPKWTLCAMYIKI